MLLLGITLLAQPQHPDPPGPDTVLEDQVGQMLLVGFRGIRITPDSPIISILQELNLGGVVLFDYDVPSQSYPRNILNPPQTKKLIADLQSYARTPLLVAVDAEGGRINRLKSKYGFQEIPSAQVMGEKTYQDCLHIYGMLARQLSDLGFNLNLAPVVDVNLNPQNPVIGALERSFSSDPRITTVCAAAFIIAHREAGIITTLKHFPGHGSSQKDSHLGLVDVTRTFDETELVPYQDLIRKGLAETIMTAHIMNRHIDKDLPATLSTAFIQGILREKFAFKGVVISDDMQMGAITTHFGLAEALILAVNAGCDLIALANNARSYDERLPLRAHRIIVEAVKEGKISKQRIAEAYERLTTLKKRYGIIDP